MNTSEYEMLLYTYFIEHVGDSNLDVANLSLDKYERYSEPFVIFLLLYILSKIDFIQEISIVEIGAETVDDKLSITYLAKPSILKDIHGSINGFRKAIQASHDRLKGISLDDSAEFDRNLGRKVLFIMSSLLEQELNELILGIDDIARGVKPNTISKIDVGKMKLSYETISYVTDLMNRYPIFMIETCSVLDWFGHRFITDKYSASLIKSWGFEVLGDEKTGLVKQVRDLGLRNPIYITVDRYDNIVLD